MLNFKRRSSTPALFSALTVFASVMIANAQPAPHSTSDHSRSLTPAPSEDSAYTPVDPEVQRQQAQQRINSELQQQPGSTVRSTVDQLHGRDDSNRGEPSIVGTGTVLQY